MNNLTQQIQNFASEKAQSVDWIISDVKVRKEDAYLWRPELPESSDDDDYKTPTYFYVVLGIFVVAVFTHFVLEENQFLDKSLVLMGGFVIYVGIRTLIKKRKMQKKILDQILDGEIDAIALRIEILSKVDSIIANANNEWDNFIFDCKDKAQVIINTSSLSDEAKEELILKTLYSHKINLTRTELSEALTDLPRNESCFAIINAALQNYAATVKRIYRETADKQVEVYREIESALK